MDVDFNVAVALVGALLLVTSGLSGWLLGNVLSITVLAPTDPVVTSTVVTSAKVPPKVRHALNLESGLNDGLALPLVLVLLVAAGSDGGVGAEALHTAVQSVAGGVIGAALAYGAGYLFLRLPAAAFRSDTRASTRSPFPSWPTGSPRPRSATA